MTVAEDLRDIAVNVGEIRVRIECLPDLVKRIDALEKSDARRTAWAAGAGAVMTAIFWVAARLQIFVIAATLLGAGCAPVGIENPGKVAHVAVPRTTTPVLPSRWATPPALLISDQISPECVATLLGAVDFWADYGVRYTDISIAHDLENTPRNMGEVRVVTGNPSKEWWVGSTYVNAADPWDVLDGLLWAEVKFREGYCTPQVAAHELGHAFGLADNTTYWNVMFWEVHKQGPDVTDEQLEQIR